MKRSEAIYKLATEYCIQHRAYLGEPRPFDLKTAEKLLDVIEQMGMKPPQAAFSKKIVINGEEQFYYKNDWEKE